MFGRKSKQQEKPEYRRDPKGPFASLPPAPPGFWNPETRGGLGFLNGRPLKIEARDESD
jgi:hypothetical protein